MKIRSTLLLVSAAFLVFGSVFVRTTMMTTFERTVAIVPEQLPTTAPNLRIAPPDLQPDMPQDTPSQSPQTQSPR